jgi:adenine-specific DNA glycosylase
LMALLPQADWLDLSHLFIYHGRAICQARKPMCEQCVAAEICPTGRATLGAAGVTASARPAREKAPARVRSTRGGRA